MGLELPSEITEPASWVGLTWPEADEDKLFEAGLRWMEFGGSVSSIRDNADASAKFATSSGDTSLDGALAAFENWWDRDDSPAVRMAEDAIAATVIGAALIVFAGITLALKIAFIVQLITLAIEVAQALATLIVSLGASAAEVPGFIAATRVICRELVERVVTHIKTVIKDLLEKAKNLFKLVKSKLGRKEAEKLGEELEKLGKFEMQPLQTKYVGEHDPLNPQRFFYPKTVHYMSDAERDAHRLVVRDGKLYRSDGSPFDTTSAATHHSGGGRAMYVMDGEGNIYASNIQTVGELHHSSFLGGANVAGAGEIKVENGVLKVISRKSGHYIPEDVHQQQVLNVLGLRGMDTSRVIQEAGF